MFQFYYGDECPHCKAMHSLIDAIEKDKKSTLFERIEVWHHPKNLETLEKKIDRGRCGGVPFFHNSKTDSFLCGEVEEKELVQWMNA